MKIHVILTTIEAQNLILKKNRNFTSVKITDETHRNEGELIPIIVDMASKLRLDSSNKIALIKEFREKCYGKKICVGLGAAKYCIEQPLPAVLACYNNSLFANFDNCSFQPQDT